jgi:hypothetical protein
MVNSGLPLRGGGQKQCYSGVKSREPIGSHCYEVTQGKIIVD